MRSDMQHVLIDRPRVGGYGKDRRLHRARAKHKLRTGASDDLPVFQTGGRHRTYGWGSKQLSDNLRPLIRFLRKSVGRLWSDVYSEIREHVSANSTLQIHIIQHLNDLVRKNVRMDEETGEPLEPHRSYSHDKPTGSHLNWEPLLSYRGRWPTLYVNPVNDRLCEAPTRDDKKERRPPGWHPVPHNNGAIKEVRVFSGQVFLKYDDGIWYEGQMVKLLNHHAWGVSKDTIRVHRIFNATTGYVDSEMVPFVDFGPEDLLLGYVGKNANQKKKAKELYGRLSHYCAGKGHQLDSNTLRRYGLRNEPV